MDTADKAGKINVGIRYCGGCNPRYDRSALVSSLCDAHSEWEAEDAEEGKLYDLLVVVGGCQNCCASYEQFAASRVWKIRGPVEI